MTHRGKILEQAKLITEQSRNKSYGEPSENLGNIALLWEAYFFGKYGGKIIDPMQFTITAEDVAWLNNLQKMARSFAGFTEDTYIDASAYAAIAGEIRHGMEVDE